jgi:site-specific recombinase XerD
MKHLSKPEITNLLQAAKNHSNRDHLMILVGYLHGLRVSEIINLTDKNIENGELTVQRLKGSKKTCQPLVKHSDPLFNEWAAFTQLEQGQKLNGRIFPITRQRFWKIVKMHSQRAGLGNKVTPHSLKHTTAKLALRNGMPLDELKEYLGHRSLSSTGAYLQADNESASAAFAKAIGA